MKNLLVTTRGNGGIFTFKTLYVAYLTRRKFKMSNSPLVEYVCLSPFCTSPRQGKIDTITIHHMAGNLSVETCGSIFVRPNRNASSNYGIDSQGRVGMYVEEKDCSWCSSNRPNDHRAITIEVANDEDRKSVV